MSITAKRFLLPLVLMVIALGVFSYFYAKVQQSVNVAHHSRVVEALRVIKQENAILNEDIYKVYSGVLKNYDSLAWSERAVLAAIEELKSGEVVIYGASAEVDLHYDELREVVEKKLKVINDFKLRHALLQNSLEYLPALVAAVKASGLPPGKEKTFSALVETVLFLTISGDARLAAKAEPLLAELEAGTSGEDLEYFLKHSRHIVTGSLAVRQGFMQEAQILAEKQIDNLQGAYMRHYDASLKYAENFRRLMYVTLVALAVLVGYLLWLVSRNAISLYREKERAQVTLSSISDGVVVTDKYGNIEFFNPIAEKMTGWTLDEVFGKSIHEIMALVTESNRTPLSNIALQCLKNDETMVIREDILLVPRSGEDYAIELVASPLRDQELQTIGVVVVFHDVTQARRMARKLEYQATHDALTGLVNRMEFKNRVSEALVTATQDKECHVLMYLDLDQFKVVNDTCGHAAGDELLVQIAQQLRGVLRSSDMLARLGGDEFGVLLPYCSLENAEKIASKLLQVVKDFSFYWEGKTFKIGVSIGMVCINEFSENLASVLSAADVACYAAKDGGRNRVHVYRPSDEDMKRRQDEMNWVAKINLALAEQRFVLYKQAIKKIDEGADPEHYFEMLIRMRDENGTIVPPGAFLPSAERYNLMTAIDHWVISESFRFYADWRARCGKPLRLSINLAGSSMSDQGLHDFIRNELKSHQVRPEDITFEITETSAIANLNLAIKMMRELKQLGCRFALDDFGAGLSSFGYLKNLPVDYIKIDGKFVRDLETDEVSRAMVEMITHVAGVMGVQTVAEFVENDKIVRILRAIGVDYAQGYGIDIPRVLSAG